MGKCFELDIFFCPSVIHIVPQLFFNFHIYMCRVALQAAVPEDCRTDPWWVPDKGHNDIVDGPNIVEYIQRLNRFVRSLSDDD